MTERKNVYVKRSEGLYLTLDARIAKVARLRESGRSACATAVVTTVSEVA